MKILFQTTFCGNKTRFFSFLKKIYFTQKKNKRQEKSCRLFVAFNQIYCLVAQSDERNRGTARIIYHAKTSGIRNVSWWHINFAAQFFSLNSRRINIINRDVNASM